MVNQRVDAVKSSTAITRLRAAAAVGGFTPTLALADWRMNLKPANSAVAQQMFDLHTMVTVVCLVIFVVVFGVMFYSLYAHRKSKGHPAAKFHESATVEALWTIIPFFILLAMAFPATKAVLDMRDASAPESAYTAHYAVFLSFPFQ